jgi:DNA-binding IclR family transcriptional regulator
MTNLQTSSINAAEPTSPYAVQVLARSADILQLLAQHAQPVSLKEIAAATGLHASTAHRILNDLAISRLVERVGAGEYKLGIRLLELGNIVKSRLSVREQALAPMRALHLLTGQTVNLSVRQEDEIMYIERAFSERSGMQVVRAIGGRAPLHLTSVGKLFLAADEARNIKQYAIRSGLKGHNHNSITEPARLQRELDLARQQGYARDEEELELGVRCIAAGIYDDTHHLVAGLSISAPANMLQDEWLAPLRSTAQAISKALGAG